MRPLPETAVCINLMLLLKLFQTECDEFIRKQMTLQARARFTVATSAFSCVNDHETEVKIRIPSILHVTQIRQSSSFPYKGRLLMSIFCGRSSFLINISIILIPYVSLKDQFSARLRQIAVENSLQVSHVIQFYTSNRNLESIFKVCEMISMIVSQISYDF